MPCPRRSGRFRAGSSRSGACRAGARFRCRSRGRRSYPIHAGYLLLSKRLPRNLRASVRGDRYTARDNADHAVTAALFWEPRPALRAGLEAVAATGDRRLAAELRYRF